MFINDELVEGAVVLHLGGRITGGPDVDQFNGKLFRYIDSGRKKVVIDLAGVERISSVGLGMLLGAMNSLSRNGGQLVVANIPDSIEELLILTKLITVLNARESIDEAISTFAV